MVLLIAYLVCQPLQRTSLFRGSSRLLSSQSKVELSGSVFAIPIEDQILVLILPPCGAHSLTLQRVFTRYNLLFTSDQYVCVQFCMNLGAVIFTSSTRHYDHGTTKEEGIQSRLWNTSRFPSSCTVILSLNLLTRRRLVIGNWPIVWWRAAQLMRSYHKAVKKQL